MTRKEWRRRRFMDPERAQAMMERGVPTRDPFRGGSSSIGLPQALWRHFCTHWPTLAEWRRWCEAGGHRIYIGARGARRRYIGPPPRPWTVPHHGAWLASTARARRLP